MLQKEQVKGGKEDIGEEHCGRATYKGPEAVRRNLACGGTEKWVVQPRQVSMLGARVIFIGLL